MNAPTNAPTVFPAHRLFEHPTIAGQGALLESPFYRFDPSTGQLINLGTPQYDPPTQANLVSIQSKEPRDCVTVGVTAQLYSVLSGALGSGVMDPTQVDVLLKIRWGTGGGQNFAIMKVGNGVAFSVPAEMLRIDANNLVNRVGVTASASPYPLRGGTATQPHYSYDLGLGANQSANIPRLSDINFTIPEPQVIPPYAQRMTISVVGVGGDAVSIAQYAPNDHLLWQQVVTLAAGPQNYALVSDVPVFAETSYIRVVGPAAHAIDLYFDFTLGL